MASKPGLFTEWPWHKLGNFKYLSLGPLVAHNLYRVVVKEDGEKIIANLLILSYMLLRVLHNQIWITFSRFQTATNKLKILNKSIEFEQVDRERNWDDQILWNTIVFYIINEFHPRAKRLPIWRTDSIVIIILVHMGPVEFIYYWLHRALHHHFLYSRYHSHHHSSIVTEPITALVHPFAENMIYFLLFSIPLFVMEYNGAASVAAIAGYIIFIDFMNNLGHCNIEIIPKRLFQIFPILKYLMYTPTFHSLHHSQVRTNYCLFMPMYDYLYCTVDKSTDTLYETSLQQKKEMPHIIHLTHPTTLPSIYHLRLGFASLASKPYASRWYLWMMWPITCVFVLLTWIASFTFTVESNKLDKLKMQTWAIPRFSFHYSMLWQRKAINGLIDKAIMEAEDGGVKVMSLGLLNQEEELNRGGELYLEKHPKLKIKLVDGSSLAVANVINSIPPGTKQLLLRGKPFKMASAIALALCRKGVQVTMVRRDEFEKLKQRLPSKLGDQLVLSNSYTPLVWLVGDGLIEKEHRMAPKGTKFVPFMQFPLKNLNKDCIYYNTPAMKVPKNLENMHSCENWLPRRVMSAWRVAGIVHALEGWDTHECGDTMFDVDKMWHAALYHGFLPMQLP